MEKKEKSKGILEIYLHWPIALSVVLLIGVFCVFYIDVKAASMMLVFMVVYYAVALWLYFSRVTVLRGALEAHVIAANEAHEQLFREMPVPYCLVDLTGNIIWKNQYFQAIVSGDNAAGKNIMQMFPNIHQDMMPEADTAVEVHSDYKGKKYLIDMRVTQIGTDAEAQLCCLESGAELVAVYLKDETEEELLKANLERERIVVGLIYIDNYEEVLSQIEEVKRSLLTALIDRKINRYIAVHSGIIRKIEKDKYFFIVKKQYLNKLLEDRFSILEEVKQVNIGNDMPVTLCIGIGYSAESYVQNYEYARTSIDMALGRGGDQAVVKSNEGFAYFGGKAQTQEKSTRVKARVKAQAFQELLESKDKVLIMGHANSDVDCLGASAGVYRMSTALGKRAYIVENTITATILPLKERFLQSDDYPEDMFVTGDQALEMVDNNTVLVVVDCNRPSIIDEPELLKVCRTIVVFDHHRQASESIQGAVLSYCEPYASSASEMITEMLQYIGDGIKVKSPEADAMYGGIVIDSQEFTNQTGVRTFEAAAYLRRCGADITRVRKIFRENPQDYHAKADAISQAEIYRNAYAFTTVDPKGLESPTVICAQTANELLNIRGIKASVVLTSVNGVIYVSARAIDEMNVQVLMERFGGGGHRTIAGTQLHEGTVADAIAAIKQAVDDMIREGEAS